MTKATYWIHCRYWMRIYALAWRCWIKEPGAGFVSNGFLDSAKRWRDESFKNKEMGL